jgi:hypothetical protein
MGVARMSFRGIHVPRMRIKVCEYAIHHRIEHATDCSLVYVVRIDQLQHRLVSNEFQTNRIINPIWLCIHAAHLTRQWRAKQQEARDEKETKTYCLLLREAATLEADLLAEEAGLERRYDSVRAWGLDMGNHYKNR